MVAPGILAEVIRGDMVESVHRGHLVTATLDGTLVGHIGDPHATIYPRSSIKPIQLQAMLDAGLQLDDEHLAISCASHSGEDVHRRLVTEILESVGLQVSDLQNTPAMPLLEAERIKGQPASALNQNCSGKHAAMLATCVINGWPTQTYLEPDHPLQVHIASTISAWTGSLAGHRTVDGCGAPLYSVSLIGLARAFGKLVATDSPIARAMAAYPHVVGGTGRDCTAAMQAVPTLIAKDGAEAVYAAAFEGGCLAFKVSDGFNRPSPALLAGALASLGVPAERLAWGEVPILGHGQPVGKVKACAPSSHASATHASN